MLTVKISRQKTYKGQKLRYFMVMRVLYEVWKTMHKPSNNQMTGVNDPKINPKQKVMEMSLVYQFRVDLMNDCEVTTRNHHPFILQLPNYISAVYQENTNLSDIYLHVNLILL